MYFSDVPDETWPAGVDMWPTRRSTNLAVGGSESSESEDERERVPKRQVTCGKQPVHGELAKKKKKEATPPPRKGGGITIREP